MHFKTPFGVYTHMCFITVYTHVEMSQSGDPPSLVPFEANFPEHPALQSGFINPVPPNFSQSFSLNASQFAQPPATQYAPPATQYAPPFAQPSIVEQSLQQLNMELVAKLQVASESVARLEKDRAQLLSRLEQSLKISLRLKNVEDEKIEIERNFQIAESELKKFNRKCHELETNLAERNAQLSEVRAKYSAERQRSDQLTSELDRVTNVAELSKRELENQTDKTRLRELQVSSMRSLINTGDVLPARHIDDEAPKRVSLGDDELNQAAALYEGATRGGVVSANSAVTRSCADRGLTSPTSPTDWHNTSVFPSSLDPNLCSIFLSGSRLISGKLFFNKFIQIHFSGQYNEMGWQLRFELSNVGSSIIQQVRILDCSRPSSCFQFDLQTQSPVWLKPGEKLNAEATFSMSGIGSLDACKVCVSYLPPGGVPANEYVSVPLCVCKFLSPVRPNPDSIIAKWTQLANCEFACKVHVTRGLSEFIPMCELGGNMFYQRAIDPNPRGAVFAGVHGEREVIVRVELNDQFARIAVRSPLFALSKSVAETLAGVISSC